MSIEQEIRQQIEKNKGLKLEIGEINNHLSILEGMCRNDYKRQIEEAYQKGLNDAWEAARKISLMSPDEIEKVFPGAAKYNRYNLGYSGVEAIEKLKAYEEQKKADEEIKVGDEVFTSDGTKFVIIEVDGYFGGGCVGCFMVYDDCIDIKAGCFAFSKTEVAKTGKHYDIDKILEEMRNED